MTNNDYLAIKNCEWYYRFEYESLFSKGVILIKTYYYNKLSQRKKNKMFEDVNIIKMEMIKAEEIDGNR